MPKNSLPTVLFIAKFGCNSLTIAFLYVWRSSTVVDTHFGVCNLVDMRRDCFCLDYWSLALASCATSRCLLPEQWLQNRAPCSGNGCALVKMTMMKITVGVWVRFWRVFVAITELSRRGKVEWRNFFRRPVALENVVQSQAWDCTLFCRWELLRQEEDKNGVMGSR